MIRFFGRIFDRLAPSAAGLVQVSGPNYTNKCGQDVMGELVRTAWCNGIDPDTLLKAL